MPEIVHLNDLAERRTDILASLRALPDGYEPAFNKTIMSSVGFHHAGFTLAEKRDHSHILR